MRSVLFLGLLVLAGCATPQQACISAAGKQIRVMDGLIADTQANLARGYAIETRQVLVNSRQVCGQTAQGEDIYCDVAVGDESKVPVAIDLQAEARKLESLLARRAELGQVYQAQVQQCVAQYPQA